MGSAFLQRSLQPPLRPLFMLCLVPFHDPCVSLVLIPDQHLAGTIAAVSTQHLEVWPCPSAGFPGPGSWCEEPQKEQWSPNLGLTPNLPQVPGAASFVFSFPRSTCLTTSVSPVCHLTTPAPPGESLASRLPNSPIPFVLDALAMAFLVDLTHSLETMTLPCAVSQSESQAGYPAT